MRTVSCCLAAITIAATIACSSLTSPSDAATASDAGAQGSDERVPLEALPGQLALRVDVARRAKKGNKTGRLQLAVTLANGGTLHSLR